LLILYSETKAFDKRSFNEGPFLAAGAGDLFMVLINGDKGIIYSDRNDALLAKTYCCSTKK